MVEIIDIAAIRKACRETGFFYAANHNVEAEVIDAAYAE